MTDASSNRVETVYLDAGEYVVEGSIRRADLTGAVHAIPNRVPITREDEQRALDKGMAEEHRLNPALKNLHATRNHVPPPPPPPPPGVLQSETRKESKHATRNREDKCPVCGHEYRRHDPEDGCCDAPATDRLGACPCGRDLSFHQKRNAELSRVALDA